MNKMNVLTGLVLFLLNMSSVVSAEPTDRIIDDDSPFCQSEGIWETSSYGTTHGGGKHFHKGIAKIPDATFTWESELDEGYYEIEYFITEAKYVSRAHYLIETQQGASKVSAYVSQESQGTGFHNLLLNAGMSRLYCSGKTTVSVNNSSEGVKRGSIVVADAIRFRGPFRSDVGGDEPVRESSLGTVFRDDFSPQTSRLPWKFKFNSDPVVGETEGPSGSDGYMLQVGGTYEYDTAFIEMATAFNQIVQARIYIPVDGEEDYAKMGIFACGADGGLREKSNCCFILAIESDTGEVHALRRKKGYEWKFGPLIDRVQSGWHVLQISAVDNRIKFHIDGELVCSGNNSECYGGVCAGVFCDDPYDNRARMNSTYVDDFRLTIVSQGQADLDGVLRLVFVRDKLRDRLVELGLAEDAAQLSRMTREILWDFIESNPELNRRNKVLQRIIVSLRYDGYIERADQLQDLISNEAPLAEILSESDKEKYAEGESYPVIDSRMEISSVDEFRRILGAYRGLLEAIELDAKESARLGYSAVSGTDELKSRAKMSIKNSVESDLENRIGETLEYDDFDDLLSMAAVANEYGWLKVRDAIFTSLESKSDDEQKGRIELEKARFAASRNDTFGAIRIYEDLSKSLSEASLILSTVYLEWIDALEGSSRLDSAERICAQFLEKYPEHPDSRRFQIRLAKILLAQNKNELVLQAVAGLVVGELTDELGVEAIYVKSIGLMALDDIDEASELLDGLTEQSLSESIAADAFFLRGYCCILQGDYAAARDVFEDFIGEYPENPKVEQARKYLDQYKGN